MKTFLHCFKVCVFGLAVFLSEKAFAQTAAVNPPTGGFAIDGNLKANTSVGDWLHGTGSGGNVLNNDGTPVNTSTTGHVTDLYGSTSDDVFTNGSKFNDYISALSWGTSSATGKDDINNGMYHVSTDANSHQWIMIAGDRAATTGTSFIDFELLQGHITQNSPAGTFTGDGTAGTSGRTENDIDISMSYTNGGTKPTVTIYRWKKNASNVWFWDSTGSYLETNAFGQTNQAGTVDNVFGAFGSTTYQQFAFVEGAVDVTQLLSSAGNCLGIVIHTIWIKTKASATSTAALKDFMHPISVSLTFNSASLTLNKTNYCSNDAANCLSGGSPTGGTYSGTGVVADATCSTGYKFDPATSGTGTFTITYSVSVGIGCTSTATASVTVSARPTVTVNSPTKCANDAAVTITATPGSGVGTDYNYAWTVPNGATAPGNVQSFSASVAGSYSVIISYKTTGCASASGAGTLTVNANPTVYTLSGNTICSNNANTGVITLSNSQTGVSYQLKKTSDNSNVQSAQSGSNGTSLQWTGLPAGVSFYVVATGASPTFCTSQTGNASVSQNSAPPTPTLTYTAPLCYQTTFSLTVSNIVAGASYTLYDYHSNVIGSIGAPAPSLSPANPHTPSSAEVTANQFTFSGIPAGSGYRVDVLLNGCAPDNAPDLCGPPSITQRVNSTSETIQTETTSVKAYPNPFSDKINFVVTTPISGKGSLEVYNMMGQKVKTVYQGFISAGTQSFQMSSQRQQVANLIYVLRIGDKKISGKILQINQ